MSRVGKKPVVIPDGVNVSISNSKIIFSNVNSSVELETYNRVAFVVQDNLLYFSLNGDETSKAKSFWGTYRALANNIIIGMTKGFIKQLEINGVGYKVSVVNKALELHLGFSHPIIYTIPDGINISVDKNLLSIKGADKQQVGQVASEIRKFRPPEPYKGKGIKYSDEVILRKAGKTAKKWGINVNKSFTFKK